MQRDLGGQDAAVVCGLLGSQSLLFVPDIADISANVGEVDAYFTRLDSGWNSMMSPTSPSDG